MSRTGQQPELFSGAGETERSRGTAVELQITLDLGEGCFRFDWTEGDPPGVLARGVLEPTRVVDWLFYALVWKLEVVGQPTPEHSNISAHGSSAAAFIRRIRKRFAVPDGAVRSHVVPPGDWGELRSGSIYPLKIAPGAGLWKWLSGEVLFFAKAVEAERGLCGGDAEVLRQRASLAYARWRLAGGPPEQAPAPACRLRVTFDTIRGFAEFEWTDAKSAARMATGQVRCTAANELTWELEVAGQLLLDRTSPHRHGIHAALQRWLARFPVANANFTARLLMPRPGSSRPLYVQEPAFGPDESPWPWLEQNIMTLAEARGFGGSPLDRMLEHLDPVALADLRRQEQRLLRQDARRAEADRRRHEAMQRQAEARRRREQRQAEARRAAAAKKAAEAKTLPQALSPTGPTPERAPLPPVPVRIEMPSLAFQETAFPIAGWRGYLLREHASLWWVSNQSDDLLALPHCRIQRLEYQLRTALRVLGPLRGRALLSDEVGLGKTIEAGLVLKELLTRGLVQRFLVLTVPSLVDQWEEELGDKFNLEVRTTNQAAARADSEKFWRESTGIVASLHTLKQPAQLDIARTVKWDLLIVDEAHYLRNRESQAWQAVNALPRQFLLLLTATPVQNSLEDLYNLVTLLQPGQLPSPKEFRSRFIDPKRPRQPREPEELRRLLGQVMIRNTRANAGVNLPPRRAETVLFEPEEQERVFWQEWETEFRATLTQLPASQSSLWGRLLLQAAGSSPAAWREALDKFPERTAARRWRERAVLEASWRKKCGLLPPLTRVEGGAVIFTQFLNTQAALAESLRAAGVETFVIHGGTPADQRQPITEEFRQRGGALLLTHSGTEGRNLQFCHRLVNFDLPWNPMEIEQRIGRLHRLGQERPVWIYNLVQSGTLQAHLLEILQEKLNLFELVVGETGLVLGERYSSDEFAEEILRRWRESEGRLAESLACLGEELAAARGTYTEVKQLDETLFAQDYESL